jgi:hypothetical protein
MNRVVGTSARQLDLDLDLDLDLTGSGRPEGPAFRRSGTEPARRPLRLLRRDVYAELARRRRRAQIAARHELERG